MELTEVSRIVANIRAFLAESSHPGKFAAALVEADQWLSNFQSNVEEVIKHEQQNASTNSSESTKDEAGVGSEPAGDRRRKGRKGRKNPA